MSKTKMMGLMLGALAMSMSSGSGLPQWDEQIKEDEESRKRRLAKSEIERNKANGLKEFFYGENSVWAINQKNADKKAVKLGYINKTSK